MSVNIIVQPHPLRSSRIKITSNPKPIAEIINSLNTGFPLSQARVCRNGEIVADFNEYALSGDTLTIKFVPYGTPQETGVGMKIGGWALIIAGAVISIASYGALAGIGVALIGSGVGLTLGGSVLMNLTTPTIGDREKPENDPSIRGGKNQSRPHGRIPVLFGRHRIYPDLAANPHTEIAGNDQYFIQMFCGGYKDYVIDLNSIKLGETSIVDLSHTKNMNSILARSDPVIQLEILQNGEQSRIYPYCVHEDIINAPLQKEVDDGDGGKISGEIIRTTPKNTDKINVDIFFPSGLGKYIDKAAEGKLGNASVEVKAWYKHADDDEYLLLEVLNITGAELKTKRYQITKDRLPKGQYDVKIERITKDSSDSKVVDQVYVGSLRSFKTERPIRQNRQKDLTIIALRVKATAKLNGMLDSFNYVATSKFPVYAPTGSGHLYWLNTAETRNPASALIYALRGRAAQQLVSTDDIDWPAVEALYAWCDNHDYTCNAYLSESVTIAEMLRMIGSTARADILRIDSKISVVQDIERPAPVQLFTPKNTIGYSIAMFNADVPEAISMQYIDEDSGFAQNESTVYNTPDGNKAIDREPAAIQKCNLWGITNSVQARRMGMYNYGCIKNRPFVHSIEADIEFLIANKGDWIQYAGDVALTGSAQGRIKGIILTDDGVCIGIDTDEPVIFTEGKHHAVRIRLSDGSIILKDVIFSAGQPNIKANTHYPVDETDADIMEPSLGDMYAIDEFNNIYYEPQNAVYFVDPLEKKDTPKAGDIYAFGIRGYEALDLIITNVQPGHNFTAVLTCVEYSPEIFDVDKPNFVLPDFINRITPVSGAVDHGAVNPDEWRSFAVYHDSEEEPERPAGNGQNDGWYLVQTFRSLWQSAKTAKSIESGAWSAPVRIKAHRGTDDVTPIWLSLDSQEIALDTDSDGNVLGGILPLIIQARLLQWNSILTNVQFSIQAPVGVYINSDGLITVSATASLNNTNNIIVRAEYQGEIYTRTLIITKNANSSVPGYLGTVNALIINSANITIIKGSVQGQVQARQGDYVLGIAAINNRSAGSIFQWTGAAWEFRSPDTHSHLYMNCFKDGLDVPTLTQDMGWFGAVFARLLIAQKAFIEELSAQVITLRDRGIIKSEGFQGINGSSPGFSLTAFDGVIEAIAAVFKNIRIEGNSFFNGDITSGIIYSSNASTGADIPQKVFHPNDTVPDIFNHFGYTFNTATSNAVSGSWVVGGTVRSVASISFYGRWVGLGSSLVEQYEVTLYLGDVNPAEQVLLKWHRLATSGIGGTLTLDKGKRGATLRLIQLPSAVNSNDPNLIQGEVFKDTAGYLRIKL